MCTAIQYGESGRYFGRSFDFYKNFGEKIVVTPRRALISFIHEGETTNHAAIIGTAAVVSGTALYFDGMNEYGICAAALNFPTLAVYREKNQGMVNVASFEIIPYLLSSSQSMADVYKLLEKVNVTNDSFSKDMPSTQLHWMISDGESAIVLESTENGVHVYEAETGVLTNSPEYPVHLLNIRAMTGSAAWDYSSVSRFVQASRIREGYRSGGESGEVSLFKILGAVSVPKGSVQNEEGNYYTRYISVCDAERLVYHRSVYESTSHCSVRMSDLNLEGDRYAFC